MGPGFYNSISVSGNSVMSRLTLAELCLWDSLPDDATGVIHHGGGLKLHGLHHIPHPDLQRQRHHDWHYGTVPLLLLQDKCTPNNRSTLFSGEHGDVSDALAMLTSKSITEVYIQFNGMATLCKWIEKNIAGLVKVTQLFNNY